MNINDIRFGYVTGRVAVTTNDATDPGSEFDEVAPSGWVYLTPRANAYAGAHREHAIIFPDRMSLPVDSEGYVTVPSPTGQPTTERTIQVPVEPGMTWQVSADLTIPAYPWQDGVEHNRVILHPFDVPVIEGQTTDLADYLPKGIDPDTGAVWIRGRRGAGLDDIRAENGQLIFEWNDDRTTTIDVPDAVQGEPGIVEDASVADVIRTGTETNTALGQRYLEARADAGEDEVQLGPELITSGGWTMGVGWAGNYADGFTHATGNTGALEWMPPFNPAGDTYVVQWTITAPAGTDQFARTDIDVHFAGGWAGITYQGLGLVARYSRAIRVEQDGVLRFTPQSSFVGRIHAVSIRRLGEPVGPVSVWRNSAGAVTNEARMPGVENFFLGREAGRYVAAADASAQFNTVVGNNAAAHLATGFFNTGLGERTLHQLTSGSRNVAMGYRALENVEAGDRNVGIGPFAGSELVNGQRNVMVGTDVLYQTKGASDNVGIGYLALHAADNVDTNIAIGRYAMGSAAGASQNVAIGTMAMRFATGTNAVAIGVYALRNSTANNNVAVGAYALDATTNDLNLVAMGFRAGERWRGSRNTMIGYSALRGTTSGAGGERNVVIGNQAGESIESGTRNIIIGSTAAYLLRNGDGNILIGDAVNTNPAATGSNRLNIGNTIYADMPKNKVGIGTAAPTARLTLPAGGSAPESAPLKFIPASGGLATPEPGAFEYYGGSLYFTGGDGVRRRIAFQ